MFVSESALQKAFWAIDKSISMVELSILAQTAKLKLMSKEAKSLEETVKELMDAR